MEFGEQVGAGSAWQKGQLSRSLEVRPEGQLGGGAGMVHPCLQERPLVSAYPPETR